MKTPNGIEPAGRYEIEKVDEFVSRNRKVSRLALQIVLSVAAFILTVQAITMYVQAQERKRDILRMREKMYGRAIHGSVIHPADLLSSADIDRELRAYNRRLLLTTFILLVVVVAGTTYIVYRRAVRHIQKILQYDIESLHAKIRFIPESEYPENEIGALMHARNLMLYSLLQAYKKEAIESLVTAVDAKDRYTHGHSRRVGHYAALVARGMNLPAVDQENVRQAGYLHDVGKIAIPEEILNAPRGLTESEWEIMKKHPSRGEAMLRFTTFSEDVRLGALTHHENHDGTGYPAGLKGDQIPMVGRILHVVDAIDAMTSTRPYRKTMSMDEVVEELIRHKGKMFHPDVVDTALKLIDRGKLKVPHVQHADSAAEAG